LNDERKITYLLGIPTAKVSRLASRYKEKSPYCAITQHLLSVYRNILNPIKYRLSTNLMLGYDTINIIFLPIQFVLVSNPTY